MYFDYCLQMGATVIVASRSVSKCHETVERFKASDKLGNFRGKAIAHAMDLSDLQSVSEFAGWYQANFDKLDVLVNNGAINYITNGDKSTIESPLRSKQGLDLTFATNYLGHFVLTERLLPILKSTSKSRIIQISSNSQYMVTGLDLMPINGQDPLAARVQYNNDTHRNNAYGNSKLAQMLHAKQLQLILDKDPTTDLKVTSQNKFHAALNTLVDYKCIAWIN